MTNIDFIKKLESNTLDLRNCDLKSQDIYAIIEFIKQHPEVTNLNLSSNELKDQEVKALAASEAFKNITNLNLSVNNIGDEGVKALVASEAFKNITDLDLSVNDIRDEGVKALAESKTPINLNLEYNNIKAERAVSLVKLNSKIGLHIKVEGAIKEIIETLSPVYQTNSGIITPEIAKDLIFKLAPRDNEGIYVKYFLERPDEYPFLINSRDSHNNTLEHYYNNNADMKSFLFEHGMLPQQERDQVLGDLATNTQGVHDKEVTEQNHFITSQLVKSYGNNKSILLEAVQSYNKDIKESTFTPLEAKLLGLSDSGKRNTLDKVLKPNQPLPDDQQFIKDITNKATQTLTNIYLDRNSGYYYHENAYNDQGDKITIPETIGLVYQLINNYKFPIEEKKELLVTLIVQNPELVKNSLEVIQDKLGTDITADQLSNRGECHKLLQNANLETTKELFSEISNGLDLDKTLTNQKLLRSAESLYWAATTYGDNSNACIAGTWTQVVNSAGIINPEYLNEYTDYKEKKLAEERLKNNITAENIGAFMGILSEKLVASAKEDPSLREALAELFVDPIDFSNPESITIAQQRVLGKVYQIVSEEIKNHLPNYNRVAPRFKEYELIVGELGNNDPVLTKFVMDYEQKLFEKQKDKQQFKTDAADISDRIAKLGPEGLNKIKEQLATGKSSAESNNKTVDNPIESHAQRVLKRRNSIQGPVRW